MACDQPTNSPSQPHLPKPTVRILWVYSNKEEVKTSLKDPKSLDIRYPRITALTQI